MKILDYTKDFVTVQAAHLVGTHSMPLPVTVAFRGGSGSPDLHFVGVVPTHERELATTVEQSLRALDFKLESWRYHVQVGAGDMPIPGIGLALAVAVGILALNMGLRGDPPALRGSLARGSVDWLFAADLSLNGELKGIRGALAHATLAQTSGLGIVVARDNGAEAAILPGLPVRTAHNLNEFFEFLGSCTGLSERHPLETPVSPAVSFEPEGPRLEDFRGLASTKRALEIALAGGHPALFEGPPGGNHILPRVAPRLLPRVTPEIALVMTKVRSAAGLLPPSRGVHSTPAGPTWTFDLAPPYRAPHHTASAAGLAGSAMSVRPGEVSLAHGGVLHLDMLHEFPRETLEALREPLDKGTISLAGGGRRVTFPADFVLLATALPCPCGYAGDPLGRCDCAADRIRRYAARIPPPLRERFGVFVHYTAHDPTEVSADLTTEVVQARVEQARAQQAARGALNARLDTVALWRTPMAAEVRRRATSNVRVLRVARTIADLAGHETVEVPHLLEAQRYQDPQTRS